jgi:hypothetical protein
LRTARIVFAAPSAASTISTDGATSANRIETAACRGGADSLHNKIARGRQAPGDQIGRATAWPRLKVLADVLGQLEHRGRGLAEQRLVLVVGVDHATIDGVL